MTMTFDDLTAYAKDSAAVIGRGLGPDGDWMPVALMAGEKLAIVALEGVPSKHYPAAIQMVATDVKPNCIAVCLSSWAAVMEETERAALGPEYRIEDDLQRREEVLLIGVGDAYHEVWWEAKILRSRATTALGEWTKAHVDGGRQPGSLMAACVK